MRIQKGKNMVNFFDKFLFGEERKSKWDYFFAHWCAYQMVALKWGMWKFRFLFHDIEKPFLRMFLPYKYVRKFHRKYHRHHISYRNPNRIDWLGLAIDWECSMLTKKAQPMNCALYAQYMMEKYPEHKEKIEQNLIPLLVKLDANTPYNRDSIK